MPLLGNTNQNKLITIEEFYLNLSKGKNNPAFETVAKNMLLLIKTINQTFLETKIWALTSHHNLVLQTEDKWNADRLIIISCFGNNEYHFEYLMPKDKSPWTNAFVKGIAKDLEEAKKYLLIAMKETRGWIDSRELCDPLDKNNSDQQV